MRCFFHFVLLNALCLSMIGQAGICMEPGMKHQIWRVRLNDIQELIDFHADKRPEWYPTPDPAPDEEHILEDSMWPGYVGDHYTANLWGWVTVPESGEYVWWLHADDQAVLYVTHDTDFENVEQVATVMG